MTITAVATPDPEPVDHVALLEAITAARAELAHTRAARARGEAGYSDVTRAEYVLQLAVQRAEDAGLLHRQRLVVESCSVTVPPAGLQL